MNTTIAHFPAASRSAPAPRTTVGIMSLIRIVAEWQRRYERRKALSELPDRFLRDAGLTRADARQEAGKPFWRA